LSSGWTAARSALAEPDDEPAGTLLPDDEPLTLPDGVYEKKSSSGGGPSRAIENCWFTTGESAPTAMPVWLRQRRATCVFAGTGVLVVSFPERVATGSWFLAFGSARPPQAADSARTERTREPRLFMGVLPGRRESDGSAREAQGGALCVKAP
jgi:hypothetical protein